jgi:hypothetical protein
MGRNILFIFFALVVCVVLVFFLLLLITMLLLSLLFLTLFLLLGLLLLLRFSKITLWETPEAFKVILTNNLLK